MQVRHARERDHAELRRIRSEHCDRLDMCHHAHFRPLGYPTEAESEGCGLRGFGHGCPVREIPGKWHCPGLTGNSASTATLVRLKTIPNYRNQADYFCTSCTKSVLEPKLIEGRRSGRSRDLVNARNRPGHHRRVCCNPQAVVLDPPRQFQGGFWQCLPRQVWAVSDRREVVPTQHFRKIRSADDGSGR
ncbi:hypothetical protein MPH_06939 [Macrophomina phaseolina MS6]|uniref:Uncharacterized protein n=1 Tax=Macrophomina phaseolina (strain MS6) TaxID=1126212 RepID=K2R0V8_MACPH|nr:hypothetical protein MPH_06939 [Macrophomina phaseolina MS6]